MTSKANRRKFSVLTSVLTLLGALVIAAPTAVQADDAPFTLITPTNNQQIKLGAKDNWYLPIKVRGAAPNFDSNRFTGFFYDSTGDVAAIVSWNINPLSPITTNVEWTFKLGLSNLTYVENPTSTKIYVPRDAKGSAQLTATKLPFKNGTLKPGTYAFQLFVENITNSDGAVAVGDVSGLTIGQPAGVKCAPGSYSKTGTWTSKSPCVLTSRGYLAPAAGSKSQVATPIGAFAPKPGGAFKSVCSEGTYQAKTGQSTCVPASRGYIAANPGSSSQVKCPAGKYAPTTGMFTCMSTEPGHYTPTAGSANQVRCPLGRYQPNFGKSFCTPALPGYFVSETGAINSVACGAGYYQAATGAASCTPAAPGHFAIGPLANNQGATMQFSCSLGMFANGSGSPSCQYAPLGYFVSTSGSTLPTACPEGWTTANEGSIRVEDCNIERPSL
jgi:hypothetical protein